MTVSQSSSLHAQDQAVLGDAGIGDQDIETGAGDLFGPGDQTIYLRRIGEVARGHERTLAQFLRQVGQHRLARARQHDTRALGMQAAGDFRPQTAGGAGDKRGLAGQIEHAVLLLFQAARFKPIRHGWQGKVWNRE